MSAPHWLDLRFSPATIGAMLLALIAFGGNAANMRTQVESNRADLASLRLEMSSMRDQYERRETAEMRNRDMISRMERMERKIDAIK